ncbi:hypothetical protein ACVWW6_005997 [Bradyrhizobium sp. USDA 3311]
MNRKDRRAQRKLSRDARPEEIFPERHGPVQLGLREMMPGIVRIVERQLGPNYHVTLFIGEKDAPPGEDRLPRFNYCSSANREDMIAVLEAFILKQRVEGAKLDRIADEPPTGVRQ